jgi:hypothetical protein
MCIGVSFKESAVDGIKFAWWFTQLSQSRVVGVTWNRP